MAHSWLGEGQRLKKKEEIMHQEEGKRTCVVSELPCSKELDVEVKDKDRETQWGYFKRDWRMYCHHAKIAGGDWDVWKRASFTNGKNTEN